MALLWILQIGTAAMFFFAGISKLAGAEQMVQMFALLGMGQWFRYVTGAIEVASAVMLLVPSLAFYGAALLVPTMAAAIATHVFVIGGSPVAAMVLFATSTAVLFMKWNDR